MFTILVDHSGLIAAAKQLKGALMFFRRSRIPLLTAVSELNDLLSADPAERLAIIEDLSPPVARALLLFVLNERY